MLLLRDRLLEGRRIALSGGADGRLGSQLHFLGADVAAIPAEAALDEDAARTWVDAGLPLHALIHDAEPAFRQRGLQPALERAWIAARAVTTGALIPSGTGGKLILLCPRPDAGPHADAARAALENLARTLSVEWARHSITVVAIAPGSATSAEELATLACFVASRGGNYLSGCRLDMGVVPVSRPPDG
jgi:NAD(P)-dependent dehydrogenase (short-subunit alcohol dehydrogenase family)